MQKHQKIKKEFKIITLRNGLKILIYPLCNLHSVSISASIEAGHLCEEYKNNGISHLLEHIIFDGTEKFSTNKALTQHMDKLAGSFSGATSLDTININGTFVDEELGNALKLLDELLFHPLLKKIDIEKEKSIIIDELSSYEDNNDYLHFLETKKLRFKGKTILKLAPGGSTSSISHIKSSEVKKYYDKYFKASNITIVIAGKCNFKKTTSLSKKIFSIYPEVKKLSQNKFSKNNFSSKAVKVIDRPATKSYIRITFPGMSWQDSSFDRVSLGFLCSLLSNHSLSILYEKLRIDLGWVYDIYTENFVGKDIGVVQINTSTSSNRTLEVLEEILKSIKQIKDSLIDKTKLQNLIDIDTKNMKMIFDNPENIVNWFQPELIYRYPKILLPKDFIKFYNRIEVHDIKRIANKILNFDKINICLLKQLNKKNKDTISKNIIKLIHKYS